VQIYFDTDPPGCEGVVEVDNDSGDQVTDAIAQAISQQLGKNFVEKSEVKPDPVDPYGHCDMVFGKGTDKAAMRVRIYDRHAYRPTEDDSSGMISDGDGRAPKA
jgi:hypothetical protein